MPEFRKDIVTREWVILAKERAKKPSDFVQKTEPEKEQQSGLCPFCPGNEELTPKEVLGYRRNGGKADGPGWHLRVTPNKFPALLPDGELHRRDYRIFDTMDGVGIHEVVIETPEHNKSIDMLDVEYVEEVVWAYRERYDAIAKHPEIKYIIIFRNHGRIAGSSLTHPHSQIVAMPVIPQKVWGKLQGVHQYYEYREKCVYCDIIHTETEAKERIIGENNSFLAVCPYASRSPFQMMILPKNHRPTFASCTRYEMRDLARILKDVLCKLSAALGNPPYNYTVLNGPSDRSDNTFHWHIDIFPRLSTPAGFEIGTGMYINTTMPEAAAEFLRQVEV
jgi:UDPglucose--hexose-1-phosphate uridylyltransferase